MKTAFVAIVAAFAGTGFAAPTEGENQAIDKRAQNGLFDGFLGGSSGGGDGESGFVSDVFDSAACVVSGFIGGGNPKCHGKGKGDVEKSSSSSSSDSHNDNDSSDSSSSDTDIQDTSYNYKYDTNDDGKYVITIQPNAMSKDDCKETYDPKDGELKELVSKAAAKCFE